MRSPDRPSRLLAVIVPALVIAAAAPLVWTQALATPPGSPDQPADIREGYEKVANDVICYCGCSRQTIYDCKCGTAHNLREQIESDLRSGKTPDDIIAAFIAEHGDQILVVPPAEGFHRLAWIGPGIAILLASGVLGIVIWKWSSKPPRGEEPIRPVPTPEQEHARDEYRQRLEKDLAKMDL